MTASVLYFHGFASSPQSQKVGAISRLIEPGAKLNAPDLNVPSFEKLDFEAMAQLGVEAGRRQPPRAIVGSSLGAVLALEVVRRGIIAPLVLIAPAIGGGERWRTRIPAGDPVMMFNHARNAQAPIHRAFFEQMAAVKPEAEAPKVPVSIVMGRLDESVPFGVVRGVWESWQPAVPAGSRFIEIAGGDHSLVAYVDVIAREIRSFTDRSPAAAPVSG
jgi:alpha-beta hydrolase superfamily lysophospholipase